MWSGPRNLSTAMMRSFGNRADCHAMDEPFYAAYLARTGIDHPMRDAILTHGECDADAVIRQCLAPPPDGRSLVYQKHMTHHMIEGFDLSWIAKVSNAFLIRDPALVLASYEAKREQVAAGDLGYRRQREIFDLARENTGKVPPVIDASDIRARPREMLGLLCEALGIAFDEAMLSWQPGPRPEDGIWGRHWYDAVWKSTGFAPPEAAKTPSLPPHLEAIREELEPDHAYLAAFRLQP